jgi:hypothetical protein
VVQETVVQNIQTGKLYKVKVQTVNEWDKISTVSEEIQIMAAKVPDQVQGFAHVPANSNAAQIELVWDVPYDGGS